ncbi:MAG: exonuclease subunit SbcD [Bacteroidales bacterium]|nr:exonuclease subunit SbcD [Bacteroidales bacterium]
MKILHTSDWHLGKKLDKFSRHQEQTEVLNEIAECADNQDIDLVLIAGDIFDTFNPPVESVELFYKTIKKLCNFGKRPVIVIAGNHDSPERIEVPDALALEDAIIFAGYPDIEVRKFKNIAGVEIINSEQGYIEIKLPKYEYPVRILLTPYANQFRIRKFLGIENEEKELRQLLQNQWTALAAKYCDTKGINLLCGHFFFMEENGKMPEEPEDEKPILHVGGTQAIYNTNIPKQIQYVALGHLHRRQTVSEKPCPIVYSGSPLSYSFSEAGQKKFVQIIKLEPLKSAEIEQFELKKGMPLIRKKFDDIAEACGWLQENKKKLVELTIESDDFLTAEDRKRLNDAHPNIISLIPIVKSASNPDEGQNQIDLNRNIGELFKDYFKSRHQQEVSDDIMTLFNEIKALGSDTI